MQRVLCGSFLVGLLAFSPVASALEVPVNDGFVTDTAGILSVDAEQSIEQNLAAYKQATSNEIAVLVVPTLDGEDIADAAVQIGRAWGVGTKENDNGILILIDYQGRKVMIATGYGLEGAVPDIVAKGIIDTDVVPHFRAGDYAGGVEAAIDSLKKHIGGEYTAERYASSGGSAIPSGAFVFLFLFLQWGFAIMARTKSWWLGGIFGFVGGIIVTALFSFWISIPLLVFLGLFIDYVISKNFASRAPTAWWAGGTWGPGGRGGRGGGFGGFGGGSFGGGGAHGRW